MTRRPAHRKPVRRPPENRSHRRLEQQADKVLKSPSAERLRDDEAPAEKCYYRSVGSVLQRDGKWFACNGLGEVVGEHQSRVDAWAHADRYGMERAGALG